ncbi:hypothetical protein ACLEPN_15395 [Myxococcus sp. 1LA]
MPPSNWRQSRLRLRAWLSLKSVTRSVSSMAESSQPVPHVARGALALSVEVATCPS